MGSLLRKDKRCPQGSGELKVGQKALFCFREGVLFENLGSFQTFNPPVSASRVLEI